MIEVEASVRLIMNEWDLNYLRKVVQSYFKPIIFVLQWRGEVNVGRRYPSGGKGENFEKGRQFGNFEFNFDMFWVVFEISVFNLLNIIDKHV